jgi:ferredoxin
MTEPEEPSSWTVELDPEKCTMCEGCVKHCPTGALSLNQSQDELSLLFDASLCHGCPTSESCQDICPEEAIRLGRGETGQRVLLTSPLVECASCHKNFAAAQKLEALSRTSRVHHELVRDLCPLCRREQLVVRFIEEERVPGSTAEYRSTTKILRESGKLRDD